MNWLNAAPESGVEALSPAIAAQISDAIRTLREGGIVAFPTDTVYGYAASLRRPAAIARLYSIKGRPEAKAIPILLSAANALSEVAVNIDAATLQFAARWWPGALTLIVEAQPDLPEETLTRDATGKRTVAIRAPHNAVATAIIAGAGGALAVTSANRSGEDPALFARDIPDSGPSSPDLIVDGGNCPLGLPSTIISVDAATMSVLREGAIPVAELANFAETLGLSVETRTLRTV